MAILPIQPSMFIVASGVSPVAIELAPSITNSLITSLIVTGIIISFTFKSTKGMTLVPNKVQNFAEAIVEFLFNNIVNMIGYKLALRVFPVLGSLFLFILISNWLGLVPGVGTITYNNQPLFRPATADPNMNAAMALMFFFYWLYVCISEVGLKSFLAHIFAPKGVKGFMYILMIPIFLMVGGIEVVSILIRNLTLTLRLYGNVYAGESLLHAMGNLAEQLGIENGILCFVLDCLCMLPFYFMELLVGFIQATVFTLLCTVYLLLSATHEEHHVDEDHAEEAAH